MYAIRSYYESGTIRGVETGSSDRAIFFTDDDDLAAMITDASLEVDDPVWRMPLS